MNLQNNRTQKLYNCCRRLQLISASGFFFFFFEVAVIPAAVSAKAQPLWRAHERLFVDALWSPAGKGLTSWLSFVMSNCDVVAFPLVF